MVIKKLKRKMFSGSNEVPWGADGMEVSFREQVYQKPSYEICMLHRYKDGAHVKYDIQEDSMFNYFSCSNGQIKWSGGKESIKMFWTILKKEKKTHEVSEKI